MQSSAQSPTEVESTCLGCGRKFTTTEFRVYRHTFPGDRFCGVCRAAEAAEADQQRADILWGQALVPKDFRGARFDSFEPAQGTAHALSVARRWAEDLRKGGPPRRGLLFHGPPGAGKTHLAVALLYEVVYSRYLHALFINVPEWLDSLREAWYENAANPPNPNGYDIVVIDDLGAENSTDWARERIYSLLNHRSQTRASTIVTTNLSPSALAERLGRASASRLASLCADVPVSAARDYRVLQASA